MNDQFEMFDLTTCEASPNATSLQEGACGALQPDLQDGRIIGRSGQVRARASRSRAPASSSEPMIQGICGRTFFALSETRDRMSSWESRLAERLATVGSTECALIWKEKATPAGRSMFRLAVSTRHTNGTGYIGSAWQTPLASDVRKQSENPETTLRRLSKGQMIGLNAHMALIAHNPTPRASDGEKGGPNMAFGAGGVPLPSVMHSYSPTPTVADVQGGRKARSGARSGEPLLNGLLTAYSPTPTLCGDYNRKGASPNSGDGLRTVMRDRFETALSGPTPNGSSAPSTGKRGAPNPAFAMWLMGFPEYWQRVTLQALIERALLRWKWPKPRSTEGSS